MYIQNILDHPFFFEFDQSLNQNIWILVILKRKMMISPLKYLSGGIILYSLFEIQVF